MLFHAMQGIQKFISTERKIKYINQLIKLVFILLILFSKSCHTKDTEIALNNLDLISAFNLFSIIAKS